MDARRHRLARQRGGGGVGRCEMQVRDRRDDAPVHLLGPGVIDVPRPEPGLDMGDGDASVISGQRARHCRRGVALDDHARRRFRVHHLAQGGEAVERLARLHQVEIDVRRQIGDREDLVEQAPMLGGDAGADAEVGSRGERADDGEQLDRLRSGAEDDQDGGENGGRDGHGRFLARHH